MAMGGIKQSVAWWCVAREDVPAETLVQAAAEIGYAAIELAPRQHWPLIQAYGLRIAAVSAHRSIEQGLNRRDDHDRIEREILDALARAVTWGIPNLIVFSGNRAGLDDETGAQVTAECLRRVAPAAEQAGVTLVLELLNSKVDHPDYQCDSTAWGIAVCRLVDSPRVKLLYDIYHMQIMEGDIMRTIAGGHAFFGHYHAAGNPGRHDLDDAQELNYTAIVRGILATGYDGYLGQEFIPKGDPIAALKAAFDVCNVRLDE